MLDFWAAGEPGGPFCCCDSTVVIDWIGLVRDVRMDFLQATRIVGVLADIFTYDVWSADSVQQCC
ncbi:hypothetical protein NBRC116589_05820 [Ruegeria sp. HU-ET01832]